MKLTIVVDIKLTLISLFWLQGVCRSRLQNRFVIIVPLLKVSDHLLKLLSYKWAYWQRYVTFTDVAVCVRFVIACGLKLVKHLRFKFSLTYQNLSCFKFSLTNTEFQ